MSSKPGITSDALAPAEPVFTDGRETSHRLEGGGVMAFQGISDDELIDYLTGRDPGVREAAAMEMQRRAIVVQRESNSIQRDLMAAIVVTSDCAIEQTEEVIRLTKSLKTFTWVLVAVGLVQLLLVLVKGI